MSASSTVQVGFSLLLNILGSSCAGSKDLEHFVRTKLQKGQILVGENIQGLYGCSHFFAANLFLAAAANGGTGGSLCHLLESEGLNDADDPWNSPKGRMCVKAGSLSCALLSLHHVYCLPISLGLFRLHVRCMAL